MSKSCTLLNKNKHCPISYKCININQLNFIVVAFYNYLCSQGGVYNIIIIIMLTVICRQNILRTITIKEVLILVTNILDQIVLKV